MDFLKLDPGLMIWTWITFGVLFFLLSKFALPGFFTSLKLRQDIIAKGLEDAELVKARLAQAQEEYKVIVRQARLEGDEVLRQARADAEKLKASILQQAADEAKLLIGEARMKAEAERAAVFEQLRDELAVLVCDGAEAVVGRAFVEEKERQWSRELVGSL